MNNIIISSDSTCDLGTELCNRYNIPIIPLGVTLAGKTYFDGVDINPDDIYAYHDKTGELPKTTATNVDDCVNFFKPLSEKADAVIHFCISSDFSSTYNNSCIAAAEFDNIYVIDSRNLSAGIGLLVLAAKEMAQKGIPAEEIVEKINAMTACVDVSFVIDNLEYLYKGGRCSALAALGANLLKLKPCITVRNGKMGLEKKYRGKYALTLKEHVADYLSNLDDIDNTRIFVTHAGVDEEIVNEIVEQVKALGFFKEVLVTRAGCTISSHCGANTLGILFIHKSPIN